MNFLRRLCTLYCATFIILSLTAQPLKITKSKFKLGEGNASWASQKFNDALWQEIDPTRSWFEQDIRETKSYGWYRIHFVMNKKDYEGKKLDYGINFVLKYVDDCEEAYLNGRLIGKTGNFPSDKEGYWGDWQLERSYNVSANGGAIYWNKENVLAIKIYNNTDDGGIYGAPIMAEAAPDPMKGFKMQIQQLTFGANSDFRVDMGNQFDCRQKGKLTLRYFDQTNGKEIGTESRNIEIKKKGKAQVNVSFPNESSSLLTATYRDEASGKEVCDSFVTKYILTPKAPATPRINNALVYGVRSGSPVILKIAATGKRPMHFAVDNLPEGLKLDSLRGVISGALQREGDYKVTLRARNDEGSDSQELTFKVGYTIALTPAMGWNSWNCWGLSVSQQKVEASAQAMIDKGLADYGYTYINIDDAWEADKRNPDGTIATNSRFPDMVGLGKWLHERGLKFGIYSSPGETTCGGYLGSLNHEKQDAETYNSWGIDYLKYDFCAYTHILAEAADQSAATQLRPYLKMEEFLRQQPRDIFYSVAWGAPNVCRWAYGVDGNSWRTTDDIRDTWESVYHIGFEQQAELYPFSMPGHWNDPDMLVVGKVGWGSQLHDSRLTADEQYSHISLWTLLASNLLIGCDIAQMDDFTLNLLTNAEVNAIDQDILGKQARPYVVEPDLQIWKRPLYDGSWAVGVFNVGKGLRHVDLSKYLNKLEMEQPTQVRDLWRQKDLDSHSLEYDIPTHGVKYLKIKTNSK